MSDPIGRLFVESVRGVFFLAVLGALILAFAPQVIQGAGSSCEALAARLMELAGERGDSALREPVTKLIRGALAIRSSTPPALTCAVLYWKTTSDFDPDRDMRDILR